MTEIIKVEVLAVTDRRVEYRNVATGATGRAHLGAVTLLPDNEAVVEIDNRRVPAVIVRVVDGAASGPVTAPVAGEAEPDPVLVNGAPLARRPDDEPIRIGDVRPAEIGFTAYRTAQRDAGRTSKMRPCVVVALDGTHATVCPVHGTNSAVRRTGQHRRLVGWKEIGLRKPSCVSAQQTIVRRGDLGPLIGRLGPADRTRIGLD